MNDRSFKPGDAAVIRKSVEHARGLMKDLRPSHGWDHTARVVDMAERIARAAGADPFIVKVAAVLHDIGRGAEDASGGGVCHAETGSVMAYEFLRDAGLDEERARHIAECILSHRFRNNHEPRSIEAKTLFDADKLDAIGAVGVGRAFLFAGEVGARLHNAEVDISSTQAYSREDTAYREYMVKLRLIRDSLLTEEGRRIAGARHEFMTRFFERLQDEADGIA